MPPLISAIFDALAISDIQISPSGDHVVYTTKPYGRAGKTPLSTLWLASTTNPNSSKPLTTGLSHDRHPRWSPDGTRIAFLTDRAGPDTCAIFVLPLSPQSDVRSNGGEAFPITDRSFKAGIATFEWSPDGTSIAYVSVDEKDPAVLAREEERDDARVFGEGEEVVYQRLRVVDVENGQVEVLLGGQKHVAAFVWGGSGGEIVAVQHERPGDESPMSKGVRFVRVVVKEGKRDGDPEAITHFPTNLSLDAANSLVWFQDAVYFVGNAVAEQNESAKAVYRLSVAERQWDRQFYGESNDAGGLRLVKGANEICAKVLSHASEEIHLTGGDLLYSGEHEINAWDVHKTGSGAYIVVFCKSGFATPPELFAYTTAEGSVKQLSFHDAHAASRNSTDCNVHRLVCKTPSHDTDPVSDLHGFFVNPEPIATHSSPWPTLVLIHGGPYFLQTNSYLAPHHPFAAAVLASQKFALLLPNYRGNPGQGNAFASAVHGKAGTVDYDDVLALVDEGIRQGLVDPARLVIAGWSWGGMLSYLGAVRNGLDSAGAEKGWSFQGAIVGAGACDADLMAMLSDIVTFRHVMNGSLPWKVDPWDTTARRPSAIWNVKKAVEEGRMPPVLILHGESDPRVPVAQARAFYRACEGYGLPCQMVLYPREEHIIQERLHLIDIATRIQAFLERYLA